MKTGLEHAFYIDICQKCDMIKHKRFRKEEVSISRPCKPKHVCLAPIFDHFGPFGVEQTDRMDKKMVMMSFEEYESIRLIDVEGMTQEQCAAMMRVGRTTVQAIYENARMKMAQCLVFGNELKISGGDYVLCNRNENNWGCRKHCCRFQQVSYRGKQKGGIYMKIAVTFENGDVFQHFGHTENFKIYQVEDKKVTESYVVNTDGAGHGALAGFLKEAGIDVLICGGIGAGAQNALTEAGIRFYGGVSGQADEAVAAFLEDRLDYDAQVQCNHHDHEGGCGQHSCS